MHYVDYIEDGDHDLYLNWHAVLLEWTSSRAWCHLSYVHPTKCPVDPGSM